MASNTAAKNPPANNDGKCNPLDILAKNDCKVQSLTVSDQHATLLISHSEPIDQPIKRKRDAEVDNNNDEHETATAKKISSLLKLTIIPFHKALLGGNPVLSSEDMEKGILPERNLLDHNAKASEDIVSFLQKYNYNLKSESGAEYSYYDASPNSNLFTLHNTLKTGDTTAEKEGSSINAALSNFGSFDIELISPASAYQISRAMPSLGHILINETPELFNTVVKPYIQSIIDSGSLSWITNVIEVKKEKERLLVNHDDFVVNIDTKWRSHPPPLTTPRKEWYNHPSTKDLYCLGIVKQNGITCLRDLRSKHITMLKEMEKEGLKAIKEVYGIKKDQIRVFIHYQPQFYHFHVHFTRLENEVGCSVERGHLMNDVIQNLEMDDEYYCKRVITFKLKKGTSLQNLIENHHSNGDDA